LFVDLSTLCRGFWQQMFFMPNNGQLVTNINNKYVK
jgi:hypothetical protein